MNSVETAPAGESEMARSDSATDIPDHMLFDILENYLEGSLTSFGRVSQVCRGYQDALSNPAFWTLKLLDRFESRFIHPEYRTRPFHDPKSIYQATHILERRFTQGVFIDKSNFRTRNSIITSVRIHRGMLIVGESSGYIRFIRLDARFNWDSASEVNEIFPQITQYHCCSGITSIVPVGSRIVSGHMDGSCAIHSLDQTDPKVLTIHDRGSVNSLSHVSDSIILSSSISDRSIHLYDVERGVSLLTKRTSPETLPHSVSSRSSLGIIGHRDKCVRILDFRSGDYVTVCPTEDWCLCVEADSSDALIRASDRAVKTFDLRSSASAVEARHAGKRLIAQFKSDSKLRLVSCGLDGQVLVSSLETSDCQPSPVHSCDDFILSIDFDRTRLACGAINGKYNVFTF
jgi:WD40 repeat protein